MEGLAVFLVEPKLLDIANALRYQPGRPCVYALCYIDSARAVTLEGVRRRTRVCLGGENRRVRGCEG